MKEKIRANTMKSEMNFHVSGLGDEPLDTTPKATRKKKRKEKRNMHIGQWHI